MKEREEFVEELKVNAQQNNLEGLTINQVEMQFGKDIAEQCADMVEGETREFSYGTGEVLVIKCECQTSDRRYHLIRHEFALEQFIVLGIDDDGGIDF